MGSKGNDSKRSKPMRRSSHTRRLLRDCVINMAEARKEIVQALQLHRSSIKIATATTTTATSTATPAAACSSSSSAQCCFYSLTESMPVPEPIWSTTAPTILPVSPSVAAAATMESLEFEWGESQDAAYNWWLGFLKTLDSKMENNVEIYYKYPPSRVFGCHDNLKLGEEKFVDANDQQQNSVPDEWLMFPTSDDQQGDHSTTNQ